MKVFHLERPADDPDPASEGGLAPDAFRSPTVTTGVFDGVHAGHRKVLAELTGWASQDPAGDAVVLTFDVHPRAVLRDEPPKLITSLDHRLRLFAQEGVDAAVVLHFTREASSIEPEAFVERILVGRIGARRVLLGEDHRFGRARRGDLELLKTLGRQHGFEARAVDLEVGPGVVISSTEIRAAIEEGRLDDASAMLGRPVSVIGDVVTGDGRGAQLGFATANLDLHHEARPPRGVYAATVTILPPLEELRAGAAWPEPSHLAVVNVGRRPTFHPEAQEDLVEPHLLGFEGDLVGRALEVTFIERLRAEKRFDGPDALVAQIERDRDAALAIAHERGLPHP